MKALDADTVLVRVQPGKLELLGRLQQRLRRDASDVDAGSAEGRCGFDTGRAQPELGSANGGDIPTGTAADNDDIGGLLLRRHSGYAGRVEGGEKIAGVTADGDHTRSPTAMERGAPGYAAREICSTRVAVKCPLRSVVRQL